MSDQHRQADQKGLISYFGEVRAGACGAGECDFGGDDGGEVGCEGCGWG